MRTWHEHRAPIEPSHAVFIRAVRCESATFEKMRCVVDRSLSSLCRTVPRRGTAPCFKSFASADETVIDERCKRSMLQFLQGVASESPACLRVCVFNGSHDERHSMTGGEIDDVLTVVAYKPIRDEIHGALHCVRRAHC